MYRVIWWSLGVVLLGMVVCGTMALLLRQRVLDAVAVTTPVKNDVARQDMRGGCTHTANAATAWNDVAQLSEPLAPLLRRSAWVPQLGADLALLPDLVRLAQHGSAAGNAACALVVPVYDADTTVERAREAAQQLRDHSDQIGVMRAHLEEANTAWLAAAPQLERSRYLAPYRDQLARVGEQLPVAIQAAQVVEQAGPHLEWLLGIESPRRFLLVSQNPFELRSTGGFLGIVCLVQVENAQASVESCQNSAAYDAVAPASSLIPDAYRRYLRMSEWRLRDANWSPDFVTSAHTIEGFWELNEQAPVDGVVAVDPYALVPLLQVTGPLALPDGTSVHADQIVDTILTEYYDGAVFADKDRLGALLPQVLERVQQVDLTQLPDVANALHQALEERHVQVSFHDEALQALITEQRWDGGMPAHNGNTLRIVDADVGYGDVNAFVERLTQYDMALSADGMPLTTTLTLTYTNRYSPWAEAPTSHAAYGNCADPETLQLERITGCYSNYLRVYVPQGSQFLGIDGVDASLGATLDAGRVVFGGYVRIDPGQQRVVQLRYRVPEAVGETIRWEKQGGTLAPPIVFSVHTPTDRATLWTGGSTDFWVEYRLDAAGVVLDGPTNRMAVQAFARHAVLHKGAAQWQHGEHAAALETWERGNAVSLALDHAYGWARAGATAQAQALFAALDTVTSDGRAAFEQAALFEAEGKDEAADQLYQAAAERSPDHPLAQLRWASRLARRGQPLPNLGHVAVSAGARRWRQTIDTLEQQGASHDALIHAEVLRLVTPDDHALMLRYADLLEQTNQQEKALDVYAGLATQNGLWGTLAGARQAQLRDNRVVAADLYARAIPLVTNYVQAMQVADGLRKLGDIPAAQRAYEHAAQLAPHRAAPLLSIGHLLRSTNPDTARMWYERAQRVDPHNGYPDHAIAWLLLDVGQPAAARPHAEAAIAKEPNNELFHALLERMGAAE